jgi:4-amino-4-deoxy-L-arabinose transferase-like glycosyltransferase
VTGPATPAAASPAARGSGFDPERPGGGAGPRSVRLSLAFQLALAGLALFALALAPRLIGVEQHLTADDQDWVRRVTRFGMAVQRGSLRETYQSGHPGVPVLWLSWLAIGPERLAELRLHVDNVGLLEKSPTYLDAVFATRRALALASAGLTVLLAFLVWRLFGPGPAVLAGLLLANEPFLVAHGRLFHTDPLLAQLMAISILAALIFFEGRGGPAYLFGSAVATGLAFQTKVPAVFLFGFIPLLGLTGIFRQAQRRHFRQAFGAHLRPLALQLTSWGLVTGLTYVLLWPALWTAPLETLGRLAVAARGQGETPRGWGNFFLGRVYREDDVGPLFYPVATLLRLSPITLGGLLLLAWMKLRHSPLASWSRAALLLDYLVLFTLMMSIPLKKIDRYLLPVYPVLAILAALGLWLAIQAVVKPRHGVPALTTAALTRRGTFALVLALGVAQAALVASVQPYPLSFYNPLLGGAGVARQAVVVGWGEGTDQVAAFLDQQPDAPDIVVSSLYNDLIHPLFRGTGVPLWEWQQADYLAVYVNMDQRQLVPTPLQEVVRGDTPVFTARINGLDYVRLYRIPLELRAEEGPSGAPRRVTPRQ